MSENPDYPDAPPTAPGGMSEAALAVELVEKHGWEMADAKAMSWPAKIECVIEHRRLAGEGRRTEVMDEDDFSFGRVDVRPAVDEDDEDFSDLDDLLAEFEEPEEPAPVCIECGYTEEEHDTAPLGRPHMFADADLYPDEAQIVLGPIEQEHALFIGMPNTKDYIFDGHRGAGPSAAERWIACTASLGATRAFLETLTPNQQAEFAGGSEAARQGTTAHAAAEVEARVVLGTVTPEEAESTLLELAIMPETEGEAYNDTMAEYISEYLDLVKQYVDEGREVLIEERVTATIPLLTATDGEEDLYDITGQVDLGVLPDEANPVLVVGDLKYGEGIDVDPDSNPQVRIYGLGLLARLLDLLGVDSIPGWLTHVEYVIIQPRLGGIKTWTETIDDLLDWQENVLSVALTEALGGVKAGAKFNPGEVQCHWCPARGGCPALTAQRMDEAVDLFDAIVEAEYEDGPGSFPETSTLNTADLAKFFAQVDGLVSLRKDLKEELQRRAFRGEQVPGYVLVNYSPPRKWKEQAQDRIAAGIKGLSSKDRDALFKEPTLVTPTAAEKLLGDDYKRIEALVDKPDKRPVIAPEGDRRSLWEGKPPEAMFDVEEDA